MQSITDPFAPARDAKNRDQLFLEELLGILTKERFRYSDGEENMFQEVQIGIQKRPSFYPFLSLHTSFTDFGIKSSGVGAGMRARHKLSDFAIEIRYEDVDPVLGWQRLNDLKWLVIHILAENPNGKAYRYLDVAKAETMVITPENPEEDLGWSFSGQVLITGVADLSN